MAQKEEEIRRWEGKNTEIANTCIKDNYLARIKMKILNYDFLLGEERTSFIITDFILIAIIWLLWVL